MMTSKERYIDGSMQKTVREALSTPPLRGISPRDLLETGIEVVFNCGLGDYYPPDIDRAGATWNLYDRLVLIHVFRGTRAAKGTAMRAAETAAAKLLRRSAYSIQCQMAKLYNMGEMPFFLEHVEPTFYDTRTGTRSKHQHVMSLDLGISADNSVYQIDFHPEYGIASHFNTKQETTKMKRRLNHILSLMQQDYTTVQVSYSQALERSNEDLKKNLVVTLYTFKVPLSLNVQEGDLLVVPAAKGFDVVRVVVVDETPQIDLDANFDYKWAMQKVDRAVIDEQQKREEEFVKTMEAVEKTKRVQEIVNDFKEHLPEEAKGTLESAVLRLNNKSTS